MVHLSQSILKYFLKRLNIIYKYIMIINILLFKILLLIKYFSINNIIILKTFK